MHIKPSSQIRLPVTVQFGKPLSTQTPTAHGANEQGYGEYTQPPALTLQAAVTQLLGGAHDVTVVMHCPVLFPAKPSHTFCTHTFDGAHCFGTDPQYRDADPESSAARHSVSAVEFVANELEHEAVVSAHAGKRHLSAGVGHAVASQGDKAHSP